MDDHAKKLFAQLDDDFPGVRVQALDALRDHLKKGGSSFRDILADIESTGKKLTDLEALYKTAEQHNAQWQQRGQQQDQRIAALTREVAIWKAAAKLRANWRVVAAVAVGVVGLPLIGWFGYQEVSNRTWPDSAAATLRTALPSYDSFLTQKSVAWGHWFNRPFVIDFGGKPFWVLYRGEIDKTGYADREGRTVVMRCLHVFGAPAEAASGEYLKPEPYNLFGWLKWPERAAQCEPAPPDDEKIAEASR